MKIEEPKYAAARARAKSAPGGVQAEPPVKPGAAPQPSRSAAQHEAARRRAVRP